MPLISYKASRLFRRLHGHQAIAQDDVELQPVKEREARSKVVWVARVYASERQKSRAVAERAVTTSIATGKRWQGGMGQNAILIHEDGDAQAGHAHKVRKMATQRQVVLVSDEEDEPHHLDDEDTTSEGSEDSEDEIDETVAEDMRMLEENFKGISQKYRLINRIGEGTFSTVYKAEQLSQEDQTDIENDIPEETDDLGNYIPPCKRRKTSTASASETRPIKSKCRPQLVALKKIYVTSSPLRIANELELLHILRNSPYICPLLTAFRQADQVIAVLPYFRHLDFRLYYRQFSANDMRYYFRTLLMALNSVHKAAILHRDIKPTNFLYDVDKRAGVLVDFGLAEKQGTDWQPCLCQDHNIQRRRDRYMASFAVNVLESLPNGVSQSYPNPKTDPRSSKRANRAGTRGFRAPEVLLKCSSQTTKIDIWSVGVILLTMLSRRFPFFNSADDVDAMIEMSSIFGKKKMKNVAALHGSVYETNIDTIGETGFSFERIVLWASCREREGESVLRSGEQQAVKFLEGLLELDPNKRWTAKEALKHEFFSAPVEDDVEKADREEKEAEMEERRMMQR